MQTRTRALSVLVPLLAIMTTVSPSAVADAIDTQVRQEIADGMFLGAVVMAGRPGKVLFHRAWGERDVGKPMLLDSIFDVASVTKPAAMGTALAITMTRQAEVRLDDPVTKYLPSLTGRGAEQMTLRHLATHRSGLDNTKALAASYRGEVLIRQILNHDPTWPVGSRDVYSCLGAIRLGEAVGAMNGQHLGRFVRENILNPLGMSDSYMYQVPQNKVHRCVKFSADVGRPSDINARLAGRAVGNAGLFATATDLSKLATLWLQNGRYDGEQLIAPKIAKRFTRQGVVWRHGTGGNIPEILSPNAYSHTGYTGQTFIIDPDANAYLMVLTNWNHDTVNAINDESDKARKRIAELVARKYLLTDLRVDNRVSGAVGQTVQITGEARRPADATRQATLVLEYPQADHPPTRHAVSLDADRFTDFQIELPIPGDSPTGPRILGLELRDGEDRIIRRTALTLQVTGPVSLKAKPDITADGRHGVVVELHRRVDQPLTGRVQVELQRTRGDGETVRGTEWLADFKLVRRRQSLNAPMPKELIQPAEPYAAKVNVELEDGRHYEHRNDVRFLGARFFRQRPRIDGDLEEWQSITPAVLTRENDAARSAHLCPPNFAASLRYGWDEQALYVSAVVQQDKFVAEYSGFNAWKHDCLQLAFDLDPDSASRLRGPGKPRRASEINAALTPEGPQLYRTITFDAESYPVQLITDKTADLAVRRLAHGRLIYEMALPWSVLGMAPGEDPKAGNTVGVAVAVNDVQHAEQPDPAALGLFGGIVGDKHPDEQGPLILWQPPAQ